MIDEFIGKTFGEYNQVTVVGWDGDRSSVPSPRSRFGYKIYTVECSVCSQDKELFGDGRFKSNKGNLVAGSLPCGCGKKHNWSNAQYITRVERQCSKMNYTFVGLITDVYTTGRGMLVDAICGECGNRWSTTNVERFISGTGCPRCGYKEVSRSKLKSDETMIESFMKSGKYVEGTKFWRSTNKEKPVSYWEHSCPICSIDEYVKAGVCSGVFSASSGHLQQGKLSCRCNKAYNWSDEQREYQIKKVLSEEQRGYTFAGWSEAHKNKNSKVSLNCPQHGDWSASVHSVLNSGTRCSACGKKGFNASKEGYVYVLKIEGVTGDFTGYGISNVPLRRLREHTRNLSEYGFKIVNKEVILMQTGRQAVNVESNIKYTFKLVSQEVSGFMREATHSHLYQDVINFVKESLSQPTMH